MNLKDLQGPYKHVFMDEGQIKKALLAMEKDVSLKTIPSFSNDTPSSVQLMSFCETHLKYLREHPKINPEHYLSNLHTMIKIRPTK